MEKEERKRIKHASLSRCLCTPHSLSPKENYWKRKEKLSCRKRKEEAQFSFRISTRGFLLF